MLASERAPAGNFVNYARKVYHPVGFMKGYNFALFVLFGGVMLGFALSHLPYLDINGYYCSGKHSNNKIIPGAAPGECYYYSAYFREKVGIRIHLWFAIPAMILAVFQFIPIIRYKAMLFHRINGYIVLLFALLGNIGGLLITRHAFGGGLDVQTACGAVFILSTVSLILAYINIKRLQIDQHRAWMLRAWAYLSTIITVQLILRPMAAIVTIIGEYWTVQPCDKLLYIFQDPATLASLYPDCAGFVNGTDRSAVTAAKANNRAPDPVQITTATGIGFGMSFWLAILLHAVVVEIYLHLTPREATRLRNVSYQRQLEAGYKHPGNGGLTVQRCGDADPFVPVAVAKAQLTRSASDLETEAKPTELARPEARTTNSGSSTE